MEQCIFPPKYSRDFRHREQDFIYIELFLISPPHFHISFASEHHLGARVHRLASNDIIARRRRAISAADLYFFVHIIYRALSRLRRSHTSR